MSAMQVLQDSYNANIGMSTSGAASTGASLSGLLYTPIFKHPADLFNLTHALNLASSVQL